MTPTIKSKDAEHDAIIETAKLMLAGARTAPKSAGIDDILTLIVHRKEKNAIADKMREIAKKRKVEAFNRDAKNVRDSEAVVLIGVRGHKSFGFNCGACGHKTCAEFDKTIERGEDFQGPTCIFKALDLGIALGSAAKIASLLNVDNRIMYRIGTAAMMLNMMSEATTAMGIPLSTKGKSPYFDRK
jgi:uncharacterized ferredoxin-like protein